MPIRIACSSCKAQLNAPDTAMGKTVKCPKCQTPIKVGAGAAPAPAPAKKPAPPPDDDYDDEDAPPKKTSPVKKGRDEDDYDDEPAPKKKPAARDEDDYDDEPPPKKGASKKPPVDDYDDEDEAPPKKSGKKGRDDDYDDEPPAKKGKGRRDDDDDDDYDDKPRKGKKGGGGNYPTATEEEKTGAFNLYLYTFLSSFCGLSLIIFLVLWLTKRKENPLLDFHGKQMLNQMITSIVVNFLLVLLGVGLAAGLMTIEPTLGLIGLVFYGLMIIYGFSVFVVFIMAMFKAKAGVYYKWPTAFIQMLK